MASGEEVDVLFVGGHGRKWEAAQEDGEAQEGKAGREGMKRRESKEVKEDLFSKSASLVTLLEQPCLKLCVVGSQGQAVCAAV